jgi:hypothetical protein
MAINAYAECHYADFTNNTVMSWRQMLRLKVKHVQTTEAPEGRR